MAAKYLLVQWLQFLKKYCVTNSLIAVPESWDEHCPLRWSPSCFCVSKLVVHKAGLITPSTQNPSVIQLQLSAELNQEATEDTYVQQG